MGIKDPYYLEEGHVSLIFRMICDKLQEAGLVVKWDGVTYQTRQFYLNDNSAYQLGAIQLCGSNDFSKKPPHYVDFRFYRKNMPKDWIIALENIDTPFRQDIITGKAKDKSSIHLGYKFYKYDKDTIDFINYITKIIKNLVHNCSN